MSQSGEQRTVASTIHPTSASSVLPTSISSVARTSVSSVPVLCYTGLIQAYPVNIDNPLAADAEVFVAAGAALFAIMGGSGDGGFTASNPSMSPMNSTLATRSTTARSTTASVLKATAKAATETITDSTANVVASTSDHFNTSPSSLSSDGVILAGPSITTIKRHREPLPIHTVKPDKVEPGKTLSRFIQILSSSQTSPSKPKDPSQASISSASAASAAAASMSAASASKASASAMSASAASEAAISFPSQISSNQGSSSLCESIGNSSCINAYALYNPTYLYTKHISYVQTAGGFEGEWLGWGCAAMFTCDNDTVYADGMTGQQILSAFRYLYSSDGVGICGSICMDNGCHLTVNACDECENSIPCDALPCYFNNGTTWPPDKAPDSPDRQPTGLD